MDMFTTENPMAERKPDNSGNSAGLEAAMRRYAASEGRLHPLRIDARTVILVTEDKCSEEYASLYRREKMNFSPPKR